MRLSQSPLALASALFVATCTATASTKPNILFILTDDQDWHMESLKHMPLLQKYLLNEGTLYSNHYCTVALCCPSRVNLWTGRAAHNTNVTDVWAPYGGYPKIVREGINENYLPTWLQDAGYNTYYSGKLWNHHTVDNYNEPFAGGFNGSDFVLDPHTYQYRNATMSRNGGSPVNYAGQYSPDVTAGKAFGFLHEAMSHDDPWFVVHAPIAPHSSVQLVPEVIMDKPEYAERHAHLFKDYKIPRTENFNPEVQGGVSWVKNLPRLNDTVVEYNDEFQRSRLRSLQSVDESLEVMIKMLEDAGQLENTYIFYTTDNGYHLSQHRMHPGKECGFDTDVHIPLIVRGPNVPIGHVSKAVTAHTDVASTIMRLAGSPMEEGQSDGYALPLTVEEEKASKQEHVTIEYWGLVIPEGIYGDYGDAKMVDPGFGNMPSIAHGNNTYKAIRLISDDYSFYYAVWCTNESELYDLKSDPGEMRNLLSSEHHSEDALVLGRPIKELVDRLDALTMVLKSCRGKACIEPWRELHPEGNVSNLKDSLETWFDRFYAAQPRVAFTACAMGYLPELEGPMEFNTYGSDGRLSFGPPGELTRQAPLGSAPRGHWSIWT